MNPDDFKHLTAAKKGPAPPDTSLRDYFAGKAMTIMWDAYDKGYMGLNNRDEPDIQTIAQAAYQMADAMLAERTKN